ncbi:ABC transporter ATP-binding protein [Salinisphaera orenii]|uniref:Amino acid ABC transporter ATP-binding protein n=1 Tax=Salinisphaera orenii YIM 95161 TaxID=1051139 RepID=A0A423PRP0_9GAMM|nr:ABC transporter ATP-binding protein [Salinisphaera halophila]ROO28191.1 amino acid ABC transporter ATP-binding protein [Salinisphaera halophila YIM 95161]
MSDAILQARGLTKTFAGFTAVENVDLDVVRGSIHALIGPNGAGKTTVFNLLTRFITPTAGSIVYDGTDITRAKPTAIARQGMVRSFQISAIFGHLSVLDNVRVALQRHQGKAYHFWRSEKMLDSLTDRAMALLDEVGLAEFADTLGVELAYGRKRALEIATTLALDPRLMLLDEPTQGMSAEDVGKVTELIRQVAADRTILMVEHNLQVVSRLADTITVLNRGEILAEGPYETVSRDPAVMEAYMGTADA